MPSVSPFASKCLDAFRTPTPIGKMADPVLFGLLLRGHSKRFDAPNISNLFWGLYGVSSLLNWTAWPQGRLCCCLRIAHALSRLHLLSMLDPILLLVLSGKEMGRESRSYSKYELTIAYACP